MEHAPDSYDYHQAIMWFKAITTHFKNKSYNAVRSDFKIKGKLNYIYNDPKKVNMFKKLPDILKYPSSLRMLYVANCLVDKTSYIDIMHDLNKSVKIYNERRVKIMKADINFVDDMLYIKNNYGGINSSVKNKFGENSTLVDGLMRNMINYESYVLLDKTLNITEHINKENKSELVWPSLRLKLTKYSCFFDNVDTNKYLTIMKQIFETKR